MIKGKFEDKDLTEEERGYTSKSNRVGWIDLLKISRNSSSFCQKESLVKFLFA